MQEVKISSLKKSEGSSRRSSGEERPPKGRHLRRCTSQGFPWEFPGSGEVVHLDLTRRHPSSETYANDSSHGPLLGELPSTAICGNDITSSCLYVCGLCAADAGVYAPLSVLLVIGTLYLFRAIYVEVCTALPMNGGTFSVLLHTTTKKLAAAAACMSILSYVATGVVSASEAVNYLATIWESCPIGTMTAGLLAFFAFLNLIGISESAGAAMIIFSIHISTIVLLAVTAGLHIIRHGAYTIVESYQSDAQPPFFQAIFFGFGAAMLGVSGFETSAQFIEEQAPGVFAKTLRNMWAAVALINPILMLEALCIVPLKDIQEKYHLTLLARMAEVSGGVWLQKLVAMNAFLVLSGAVLTSYVGVVGLTRRLALDACLPEILLHQNRLRGTNHNIIIGFLLICTSMYIILQGDTAVLSKVYSVSFLGLMITFCLGNLMLKTKRKQLPRDERAPIWSVLLGMLLVSVGLTSTIVKEAWILKVFLVYYICCLLLVAIMFWRNKVLKMVYRVVVYGQRLACCTSYVDHCLTSMESDIQLINSRPLIFLTKGLSSAVMNKAIMYVLDNEDTQFLKFVHFKAPGEEAPQNFEKTVRFLDRIYPKIKVDMVIVEGSFTPENVYALSEILGIPRNRMFMACPSVELRQTVASLGGVRVITH